MTNLFWDSCVFSAFLYDEKDAYDIPSLEQYLEDAKQGKCRIFTSSVVFAEVSANKVKRAAPGSMDDLIHDLTGSVTVMESSVPVMQLSGRLKDIPYKKAASKRRVLGTGDAVMLATALHLEDAYGITVDAFHTYDNTKKKFIPLLSYEEWCDGLTGANKTLADRVCTLRRVLPIHPAPPIPGILDAAEGQAQEAVVAPPG